MIRNADVKFNPPDAPRVISDRLESPFSVEDSITQQAQFQEKLDQLVRTATPGDRQSGFNEPTLCKKLSP